MRLGRDEVPAEAHRLRVLVNLGMDAGERGQTGTFAPSSAGTGSRYLKEGGAARVSASIRARQLRGAAGVRGAGSPSAGAMSVGEGEQGLGCLLPPHFALEDKGLLRSNFGWSG